jgi:hypothetical protein
MATLEDLRIADWAKPENANLAERIEETACALREGAALGRVGGYLADDLADRIGALLGGWASEARWWLRDYREQIDSLLRTNEEA